MFDMAASWVATPGTWGYAPAMLKEFAKVSKELPPVGGKVPVPFATLTGNMVMLHQITIVGEHKGESER